MHVSVFLFSTEVCDSYLSHVISDIYKIQHPVVVGRGT